jgi:hypothetical protein
MRIGIDFDNTLACYDQLFWTLARDCGSIEESVPHRKDAVRDNLRQRGLEPLWTKLQGQAYGPRILEASPFPDALAAVAEFRQRGWDVFVVSHKTRTPIAGPEYDLHASARNWLKFHGLFSEQSAIMSTNHVCFELTKRDKLQRIADLGCDWFIDDLPELLTDPNFPPGVGRILFDPHHQVDSLPKEIRRLSAWQEAASLLTAEAPP